MEYLRLVSVTEILDICPIKGVSHQVVNLKIEVVIALKRIRIKTTGDVSVRIFMIPMIFYHSAENILFHTAIIILLFMIL